MFSQTDILYRSFEPEVPHTFLSKSIEAEYSLVLVKFRTATRTLIFVPRIYEDRIGLPSPWFELFEDSGPSINVTLMDPRRVPSLGLVKLRPLEESFYEKKDVKKELEQLLVRLLVLSKGQLLQVGASLVRVETLLNEKGEEVEEGLAKDVDLKVEFLEIPGYEERKKREREEEEKRLAVFEQRKKFKETYREKKDKTFCVPYIVGGQVYYKRKGR